MDRKHCILLYSNYSQASIDLLAYIKNLPLDFPTATGVTMTCVDNEEFKTILHNNGIEFVPVLLIEYYNGTKQKLERDYIYMWIDQIIKALHIEYPKTPQIEQPHIGSSIEQLRSSKNAVPQLPEETDIDPVPNTPVIKNTKVDISELAQQMAKDRDIYIAQTDPNKRK
jgi:hypothetical protein